ncbi:L-lactate permease [Bryobacter aggregatus]|uniref:L-lactate permease n=1 Tax=Bryobacter aggregatus TaxID=360054 RepID=UPI0004E13B22|nr:L-lactate permease [Bryobacter aggregatus]
MNTVWTQSYEMGGLGLWGSALVAAIPIFVLLVMLGVLRKPAWMAAMSGLASALVVALAGYGMPGLMAVSSVGYGAAFALFPITWIIFWAIALYRLTVITGKFEVIKQSIASLTGERPLQALLIAFAFGAFIEGAAGFGTPVAVAAAMLVGVGFGAFEASAICLLANTAPVAFGSIGIPVVTLAGITGLPLPELSAQVGRLCAPVSFLIPAYLIAATEGFAVMRRVLFPSLLCGGAFASVQFLVSNYLGAQLVDILSSLSAIIALLLYLVIKKNSSLALPIGQVFHAWSPYLLLVGCVLVWGHEPIAKMLNASAMKIEWPMLHNLAMRMPPVMVKQTTYAAVFNFNLLAAAGTSCMVATILSALVLKVTLKQFFHVVQESAVQLRLPTLTVCSVLGMAFLMNYSGATGTLGLAFAATGVFFPFFSAMLGWLGVFLTGSDTSANALFGNLQVVTAGKLGLDPVLMAASNSSGGVMGKMISLQTIAVAAAATKMSTEDQARLFRFTFKHSVLLASIIGLLTFVYSRL